MALVMEKQIVHALYIKSDDHLLKCCRYYLESIKKSRLML